MSTPVAEEPQFAVLDYITISRDPRTQLVVAIGGHDRSAGILQTIGGFVSVFGPRGDYHRQPHTMPVDQQRQGATAAAHALLLAGFSVHLDPPSIPSAHPAATGRPPTATSTSSPSAPARPPTTAMSPPCCPRSPRPMTDCCPAWCRR
ncbi:hypothetical protein OG607_41160 [Streptomyces sp. NBC_01537]|uniref:hypothetical protein n=1 Tax=Streptomyces sp. NBC_01537 TaxID=2903896 RepID=UPI0038668643